MNPRNLTGGTLKQLDSRMVATRPLKLFLYEVVGDVKANEVIARLRELIVQAFQATGEVPNVVNRLARSSATRASATRSSITCSSVRARWTSASCARRSSSRSRNSRACLRKARKR